MIHFGYYVLVGHKEMTFEASSYILFIIRPWRESVMDKFRLSVIPRYIWRCVKGVWSGDGVYRWTIVETIQVPQELSVVRDTRSMCFWSHEGPCGLFDWPSSLVFWIVLTIIPLFPKQPSFPDQKKCPTCSILFVGNLLTSTEPNKEVLSLFFETTTGDTEASKVGKEDPPAGIEH